MESSYLLMALSCTICYSFSVMVSVSEFMILCSPMLSLPFSPLLCFSSISRFASLNYRFEMSLRSYLDSTDI